MGSSDFSWCGEARKSELLAGSGCQIPVIRLPKLDPEPFVDKALRVLGAVLEQRSGGKLRSYGNTKSKKPGVCRFLRLGQCNLLRGGQVCRRNNRLTRYCRFKGYFALREDGTISNKLSDDAYLLLLQNLRSMKVREISYG